MRYQLALVTMLLISSVASAQLTQAPLPQVKVVTPGVYKTPALPQAPSTVATGKIAYDEAMNRMKVTGRPVIVWVGQKPDVNVCLNAIHLRWDGCPDAYSPSVVVKSSYKTGYVWRTDLDGRPTRAQIDDILDPTEVVSLPERVPAPKEQLEQAPTNKTCPCSPACECGCNSGRSCSCSSLTLPVSRAVPTTFAPMFIQGDRSGSC